MPEPIGSIIAYAGEITSQWEKDNGWLLCNGRPLGQTGDTAALFGAIRFAWGMTGIGPDAKFNLPDLRGYFLRGVDASQDRAVDKDSNARFARHNGNVGPKVGSFQSFATALPQGKDREFKTRSQGGLRSSKGSTGMSWSSNWTLRAW
jgi:hypothetical protein